MATSFAAYASQYLNKQQNVESTTSSSTQPMFFSFTTDDGSRHGGHDTDLDDFDDPHLRESETSTKMLEHDDEDPYLRLDEDEHVGRAGFNQGQRAQQQAIPLITRSPSPDSPPGWLAHLAGSPRRSPSPAPSSSSDSSPPADLLVAPSAKTQVPQGSPRLAPPPRTAHSLSLTESLLPRDGRTRPLDVFSLPDPRHTPRKRRKHHDAAWISLWLGLVTICVFFSILLLFVTRRPKDIPSVMLPYTVLLRTVPMLVILTFLSAAAAYAHVYLLRVFVKPVMIATSVFIPATLFISAIWAFVGSFMWDGDTVPTWGETVGLRLFALVPLVLSIITARRLLHLPRQIHTTSSTLTLTTHLLMNNPFLLALSPAILLVMLLGSLPFATLIFRLLLVGYSTKVGKTGWEWHVRAWANWAIVGVLSVWLWSWAVARGVLRTTCASVIGAWYFANPSAPLPPPTSTHTIHAALVRSTGPSLGSIVLSSLILTLLRLLALSVLLLRRLPPLLLRIPWVPLSVPVALYVVPGVQWTVAFLEEKSGRLSRYALIYAGLTGAGFWESATRGRELISGVEGPNIVDESDVRQGPSQGGRNGRRTRGQKNPSAAPNPRKRKFGSEPPLALLTISPLTLSFPFALMTYLFVAHTLGAPNEALGAALLAGGVTALVGLFCVGLVKDTADTLYLCYCIDKASGEKRREEVFIAFEYDFSQEPSTSALPQHQQQQRRHPRQPETIVPRPPTSAQPKETLFNVEDSGDDEAAGQTLRTQGRKLQPQPTAQQLLGQRTTPLSPYPDPELDEMTPTAGSSRSKAQRRQMQMQRKPAVVQEESDDDLDPFKRSTFGDEEATVEGSGAKRSVGFVGAQQQSKAFVGPMATTSPGGTKPLIGLDNVGLGLASHGHQRSTSGGGGGGIRIEQPVAQRERERMMTSTQELNMKSQFLMNMRAFGAESQDSEATSSTESQDGPKVFLGASPSPSPSPSATGHVGNREEGASEGEESQLGPGSDFFR